MRIQVKWKNVKFFKGLKQLLLVLVYAYLFTYLYFMLLLFYFLDLDPKLKPDPNLVINFNHIPKHGTNKSFSDSSDDELGERGTRRAVRHPPVHQDRSVRPHPLYPGKNFSAHPPGDLI